MAVVEQTVACPHCEEAVDVQLSDDKSVVGTAAGHAEEADALNQVCTNCVEGFHVRVA